MQEAPSAEPFVDLGAVDELPRNSAVSRTAGGRRLLLCRLGDEVFALAERCTHAAWSLEGGELRNGEIVCALHGARFDLRTGEAAARPATKPLRTFPVRIRAGRVEVRVPPLPR